MREAMSMLLPMPHLRKMRLDVPLNFLERLDVDFYSKTAEGLPALETLILGSDESVPLHHLAAFCGMLTNVTEVSLEVADCEALEEEPREEWACPHVQWLTVHGWDPGQNDVSREVLHRSLETYFPNTELAKTGPDMNFDFIF